jgi:hypothetical protein
MAVGFGNWPSWLREWSQSLGVGLAMVTLASSLIAVPLSAAGQLNLADGQVTAWVMTIHTVPCVLGIVLTLHFRQPLLLTGNIFVLIFIVSLQGRVPFAELAGASLVAGAAVVAISALGLADHLARLIPEPVWLASWQDPRCHSSPASSPVWGRSRQWWAQPSWPISSAGSTWRAVCRRSSLHSRWGLGLLPSWASLAVRPLVLDRRFRSLLFPSLRGVRS